MASIRYLGSKARIAHQIMEIISNDYTIFYDLFCGTGALSELALQEGFSVAFNDILKSATILTEARCLSYQDIGFNAFGGYHDCLEMLNNLDSIEGFIYNEYSPDGTNKANVKRKYFTSENAGKIDAIRNEIEYLFQNKIITTVEKKLLISDLLEATNRIANTSGTYGCFLKSFTNTSLLPLNLKPRNLHSVSKRYKVYNDDVFNIIPVIGENAVIYLDPPYTKRQYPAYYHILETITEWDSPIVGGVTGLRNWHDKASPFSYKTKALEAIIKLTEKFNDHPVYLSYSSEGHVPYEKLVEALKNVGAVTVHKLGEVGRYRPNKKAAMNSSSVSEFLIEIQPN